MADSQTAEARLQPPKEMSMEMRLLLALLLTVPILFLGPYFLGSQTPPPEKKAHAAGAVKPQPPTPRLKPAAAQAPQRPKPRSKPPPRSVASRNGYPAAAAAVDGHRHRSLPHLLHQPGRDRAQLAAQGPKYQGQRRQAARSGQFRRRPGAALSSHICPATKTLEKKLNWTYYAQTADPDGLGVTYRFSDGHVA